MPAALDPRREAPDEHVVCLAGDFLDSLISSRTRSSYATGLAIYLRCLKRVSVHPLQARRADIDRFRNHLTEHAERSNGAQSGCVPPGSRERRGG
jgi:hypothetical protein